MSRKMESATRQSENKPVMLFDGDCGFCRKWIEKWKRVTAGKVDYYPYQDVIDQYPQVSEEECARAVQLIRPDGTACSAARAVFEALAFSGRRRGWLWMYEHVPLFGRLMEFGYTAIARHRTFFSRLTRTVDSQENR